MPKVIGHWEMAYDMTPHTTHEDGESKKATSGRGSEEVKQLGRPREPRVMQRPCPTVGRAVHPDTCSSFVHQLTPLEAHKVPFTGRMGGQTATEPLGGQNPRE
jgi:hypothetical protein